MASTRVLMIDNYDSFTWNLYEYLCNAGADVSVFRNDAITIDEITAFDPDLLLISPGPGHPSSDAGISKSVIEHFKGIKPIFGVCMGQQCIFEVFGGNVGYAGEIVHGKTSTIKHDNLGMFKNVPQDVSVTRYHSLAGSDSTLPDCLQVTAKTDNDIIMGVRHKEYTIEGVQFHPESILTEEGHLMIKNILSIRGGYWKDNAATTKTTTTGKNILQEIYQRRRRDVAETESLPGKSFQDLKSYLDLGLAPAIKDYYSHLKSLIDNKKVSIMSEIKRASPSKGDIDPTANAAIQATNYALAGVAGISVLTEPNWFKGSLEDLKLARKSVDLLVESGKLTESERPCILRKEFIFNEYQILEARLAGADTVLLIVKMLSIAELENLTNFARSLGMEPLIEVNNDEELQSALKVNAKVIGVNNRNLVNFEVDLSTTTNVIKNLTSDIVVLALSGISKKEDIDTYTAQGVYGFLIGESLMRAGNKVGEFIHQLQN
ncbi:bifunctional anthranilate synthase/indole-3-glycerol-phosphate synthase [Martiniozyma asiatica (nom. inval.)]|nr:bifunctional anthranilate synthase/indole-3-glycerol-phosphate synthase [Martiniozyma asiatica]